VDPESVEAIATAIEQLIHDQALAEGLVRRGIEWGRGFSWEKAASETWQVYQKVTA
jgi:glycosyltransferase involved in cell wall biosynthesis